MTNRVPLSVNATLSLGSKAHTGALTSSAAVLIEQNPAPKIATDLFDLAGDPSTPLVPGKQAKYASQKSAVKQAFAARDFAVHNGLEYCRVAIGALKPSLGNRWNSLWNTAGFVTPSLALPADPMPMLIQFREFFNANPAKEVTAMNATAAQAQMRITALEQAHSALAQARTELLLRKGARDIALKTLRARLSGLRSELEQILSPYDGRWYDFGFRRPADRQAPDAVSGLLLTLGGSGVVLAKWDSASLADNYRVTWRPSSASEGTQVGILSDTQCLITGLPSGEIVVAVSARNAAGETAPTEATITLP